MSRDGTRGASVETAESAFDKDDVDDDGEPFVDDTIILFDIVPDSDRLAADTALADPPSGREPVDRVMVDVVPVVKQVGRVPDTVGRPGRLMDGSGADARPGR